MTRTASLLVAVVLVVGGVSAFPMAAAAQFDAPVAPAIGGSTYAQVNENASGNATNVTPGQRLSAVVAVGHAEFEGDIERRAYGIEVARAATADAKAGVVADRLATIEQQLADLEARRAELEAARENGTIDEGEYRARVTELSARTATVEQLAADSEARAGELPADVLEQNGINVTAIQTLRQDASELRGEQVAAIARSIAGPDVGESITRGPPEDAGARTAGDRADGDAQAAIDRAADQVDAAESRLDQVAQQVDETNASENATDALERARDELEQARTALEDANAALDAGNDGEAASLAEAAVEHAEQAVGYAEDALEAARSGAPDDGRGDGAGAGASGSAGEY